MRRIDEQAQRAGQQIAPLEGLVGDQRAAVGRQVLGHPERCGDERKDEASAAPRFRPVGGRTREMMPFLGRARFSPRR